MTRTAENIVRQDVHYCVSSLVHTLAKSANGAISSTRGFNPYLDDAISETMHLCDQAFELSTPIDDWEEAAIEAGWTQAPRNVKRPGTWWREKTETETARPPIQETAQDACAHDDIEPHAREVFEHWIVSDWLADKLAEKGEKVDKDFAGLTVWARTTTGQAVYGDAVIEEIAADLTEI